MSMQTAAIYLRELRERQGLSRARIAARLDISEMSLWRIEEKGQEPKAELLMSLVQVLNGNIQHVYELMISEDATASTAREFAQQWLSHTKPAEEQTSLARLVELAKLLESNPQKYGQLLGYAERLREENSV